LCDFQKSRGIQHLCSYFQLHALIVGETIYFKQNRALHFSGHINGARKSFSFVRGHHNSPRSPKSPSSWAVTRTTLQQIQRGRSSRRSPSQNSYSRTGHRDILPFVAVWQNSGNNSPCSLTTLFGDSVGLLRLPLTKSLLPKTSPVLCNRLGGFSGAGFPVLGETRALPFLPFPSIAISPVLYES